MNRILIAIAAVLALSGGYLHPAVLGAPLRIGHTDHMAAQGRVGPATGPQAFPLWDGPAPGAKGSDDGDRPSVAMYPAAARGGPRTAVVIAPGGAYMFLSMETEGRQWAYWFNAMGVTAFVLKYRLGPTYHYPVQLDDGERAMRLVRSRAATLGFDADRIGLMGFSAGGHLAAMVATHFDGGHPDAADPIDRLGSRPDFLILAYPVISFSHDIAGSDALGAYAGSGRNLLGDNPVPALLDEVSAERSVTAHTPPTFLFQTTADTIVSVKNSVAFYSALVSAGVPVEMHLFEKGFHGAGMGLTDSSLSAWPTLLMNWLRQRGLLSPPASGRASGVH